MNKQYLFLSTAVVLLASSYATGAGVPDRKSLTLESAVAKAVAAHPALSAAGYEWQAADAEALQAGLRPNPVFGAEVENVAGSGAFSGTDVAEYTLSLSQTFELGGKRQKRAQAALLQGQVAGWSREEVRRSVEQQTIRAFYTAWAAQSRLGLSKQQLKLAQTVVDKAQQRVDAGRANRLEVTRARIELADAQLEQQLTGNTLRSAKQLLASLWGGSVEDVGELEGELEQVEVPPSDGEVLGMLEQHPAYHRVKAEVLQAQAVMYSEDAQRIPDIDVNAGLRLFEESGDQAVVAGLSIPLAFGNRNQGNREAARFRVLQANERLSAVQLALSQELIEKTRAVREAYETVLSLEEQQVPIAREAFELASDGYEKGLFGSLDLLDAMRSLFEQETRHVNALLDYHLTRAELLVLIAPATELKENDLKED